MATRRSSRKRSIVPLDTQALTEADADFWGQDAFADEGEDEEFDENALSDRGEDIVDSDFDAPEGDGGADGGAGRERELRASERASATARRKSRSAYVDPASRRRKRRATDPGNAKPRAAAAPAARERSSLRSSTKRASAAAAESRARRAEQEEKRRVKKAERDAKRPVVHVPTQEEMLEEAKETELANKESLKDLLKLEEERKRVPVRKTSEQKKQVLSLRDRNGAATISFTDADTDARRVLFPQDE